MPTTLISSEDWKQRTYRTFSRRSTELKAIDAAIENFHKHESWRATSLFLRDDFKEQLRQTDLLAVDKAFGAWKSSKGVEYLSSGRNENKAIQDLEQQLRAFRVLTPSEQAAFAELDRMRGESIKTIFGGTRLEWKSLISQRRIELASVGVGAVGDALTVKNLVQIGKGTAGSALVGPKHAALAQATRALPGDMLRGAFGVNDLSQLGPVLGQIIGDWLKDFIAAITPWIGIAVSGAKAIAYAGLAAKNKWDQCTLVEQRTFMRSGDPSLAADALNELLTRSLNNNLRTAARSSAELAGKLTSAFVDGGAAVGPAIGAASSIAGLIDTFYMIGRDWQEKNKVNLLLSNPATLTSDIFATCPLLGAYYLSTASDYEIMMILVEDFGRSNWLDMIEKVKASHIAPLQGLASSYVFNSRFALVDSSGTMLRYKGTIPQGAIDKLKKTMGLTK